MNKNDILQNWDKYLSGKASEEELRHLYIFLNSDPGAKWLKEQMEAGEEDLAQRQTNWPLLWQRISTQIEQEKSALPAVKPLKKRRLTIWRYGWAAAVVLVAVLTGSYLYLNHSAGNAGAKHQTASAIVPGHDGAILTLSDGTQVNLDSVTSHKIDASGASTIVLGNNRLIYNTTNKTGEVAYNTLTTPVGRKFHVVLSDGTHVWLNAGSSLRYPVAFLGSRRDVQLKGEGYFEVAKDPTKPFVVDIGHATEIKVLGTHFNVEAYDQAEATRTTLLEGAIELKSGTTALRLRPGQQALTDQLTHKTALTSEVNMDKVVAWQQGYFVFDGDNIKDVMAKISNWYDVGVVFEDNIDGAFVARISMNEPISKVLDLLALTQKVRFEIKDRQILVKKW